MSSSLARHPSSVRPSAHISVNPKWIYLRIVTPAHLKLLGAENSELLHRHTENC